MNGKELKDIEFPPSTKLAQREQRAGCTSALLEQQLRSVFAMTEVGSGHNKHRNIPLRCRKAELFPGRSNFKAFFHSPRTG